MAKKPVSKSQKIRELLDQGKTTAQIKKQLRVSSSLIAGVRSAYMKKKVGSNSQPVEEEHLTIEELKAVKDLADELGGIRNLRIVTDELEELSVLWQD